MKLIDKLFGRSSTVTFGKQCFRNSNGKEIAVTKKICYTVKDGTMNIHMYDQQDEDSYCAQRHYLPVR